MNKIEISEKLKAARLKSGLTQKQVADEVGKSPKLIGHWETGYSQPDADTLGFLFHLYNLSANDFFETESIQENLSASEMEHIKKYRSLDGHGKKIVDMLLNEEFQRIQKAVTKDEESDNIIELNELFQKASAGRGTFADDETTSMHKVKLNEYTRKADIIIHVYGDSMEPDYHDGDALLVHQQPSVDIGDIGIFIHQGERYVKKFGGKVLISLNKNYEDIPVDDTTICFGKVLGILKDEWIIE